MNKSLLILIAAAACGATASGTIKAPTVYPNASFQDISANGRYAVSELDGVITIYDLQEGTQKVFSDETYENYYGLGHGKSITADGSILIGSTKADSDAAYYNGTEWVQLNVPNATRTNLANAITPDGKRICGSIGVHEMTISEDALMQAPAYWDRKEDGTYGECQRLPYPETDFLGSTPQYVTAVNLSDDGKIIVGQVVDCRGGMTVPIVYTQADNGEWSYSFPTRHLFNPDNIAPVENPGEAPECPSEKSFMTEEEIAAYDAAMEAYYAQEKPWEGDLPYPEYSTYMTEEEKAEFNAAYAAWETAQAEWQEKFFAFDDYYYSILETSPSFVFNNAFLSADGKMIASSIQIDKPNDDPLSWSPFITVYTPTTVDVATGEFVKYDNGKSLLVTGIAADGTVLAGSELYSMPMVGYLLRDGEITTLLDYLNTVSPEYGEWFKDNMTHELLTGYELNEETEEYVEIYEELTYTGNPVATPDLSVIAIWNDCPWDETAFAMGIVLDLTTSAGVTDVAVDDTKKTTVDADGNLSVADDVTAVAVYNLAGSLVATAQNPAGTVTLDLNSGLYVAKVDHANGATEVLKVTK